jgi:hypothetical protein
MAYTPIGLPADFERTIKFGETAESLHLEFKRTYRWRRPDPEADPVEAERWDKTEVALEAARDLAQFANTEGGVLVIGVAARPDGCKVADHVEPVTEVDGLRGWLEDVVRNHLDPPTFSHPVAVVETGSGTVLAVNVEPSLHLVALWTKNGKHGIEYLRRVDHHKEWMNPGEVERHLMNSSRAMSIRLKEVRSSAQLDQPVDLAPCIYSSRLDPGAAHAYRAGIDPNQPVRLLGARPMWSKLDDNQLELTIHGAGVDGLGSPVVALPVGLVREAWLTADRRAGLCLSVRIVMRTGRTDRPYELEPL